MDRERLGIGSQPVICWPAWRLPLCQHGAAGRDSLKVKAAGERMPYSDKDARLVPAALPRVVRVGTKTWCQPGQGPGAQVEPGQHVLLSAGELQHQDETVTASPPVVTTQPPRLQIGRELHG